MQRSLRDLNTAIRARIAKEDAFLDRIRAEFDRIKNSMQNAAASNPAAAPHLDPFIPQIAAATDLLNNTKSFGTGSNSDQDVLFRNVVGPDVPGSGPGSGGLFSGPSAPGGLFSGPSATPASVTPVTPADDSGGLLSGIRNMFSSRPPAPTPAPTPAPARSSIQLSSRQPAQGVPQQAANQRLGRVDDDSDDSDDSDDEFHEPLARRPPPSAPPGLFDDPVRAPPPRNRLNPATGFVQPIANSLVRLPQSSDPLRAPQPSDPLRAPPAGSVIAPGDPRMWDWKQHAGWKSNRRSTRKRPTRRPTRRPK
jgi:hypothetical protein